MVPEAEFVGYDPTTREAVQQQPVAPATVLLPKHRLRPAAYIAASTLLSMTQGLGMNLIAANIPQIQGYLGATNIEATWLIAAYMAPNVSLSIALIKIRNQYGLRNFAELSIAVFVLVSLLHLFVTDLQSAIIIRFVGGIAAAPLSSLAFLYMLEAFTPARKMTIGICLVLTNISLASPLARLLSPTLLDIGQWPGLYMFEIALALIALGVIYVFPLTPMPRAKVIEKLDIVSYLLIAIGFGCTAVVLVTGRLYWWREAPWLGVLLAVAVVTVTSAVVIELNREKPLLDIRWIASKEVLHFAGTILLFRLAVSEQSSVASNFFQNLGLQNDQLSLVYIVSILSMIAACFCCAAVMKIERVPAIHATALILLIIGSYMDSQSTNLTRPINMYVSQAFIAAATALFLPPAMSVGLMSALKRGPNYILSFIIVFLSTQSLGGLLGQAAFGSFITIREKFHSNILAEHITMSDPLVVQRAAQLANAYGRVIGDKALLNAEGAALLSQQVTREANILAYNDAFLLIAGTSLCALIALLLHVAMGGLFRSHLTPATAQMS
ncbi:MFS transporter [Phyllobacterium brassicacearum]|uniref:MFS transporter n=1 Tax=Phyllobacterium brassicacearum TaxID=314235 RepID=A0A2P7BU06_9HYPH|nr:MFS transporter [Phyllobacterium brassicacearum]TDQ35139.1 MFS transporter [Phyllobacterium brassicacearum]